MPGRAEVRSRSMAIITPFGGDRILYVPDSRGVNYVRGTFFINNALFEDIDASALGADERINIDIGAGSPTAMDVNFLGGDGADSIHLHTITGAHTIAGGRD